MIEIVIPYERIMVEIYDAESPWKFSDQINPEILDWMEARISYDDWDYEISNSARWVTFKINSQEVALLFKLTWGGA